MSFVYWLSKFSREAMLVELFLIACITTSYFGYLLIKKRKYGSAKNNIPDNVVRAYLAEMISQAEGFKNQLFGESFKIEAGRGMQLPMNMNMGSIPASFPAESADTGALRAQLAAATAKQQELSHTVAILTKEKSSLEGKLSSATHAASAGAGAAESKAVADLKAELAKYKSRLEEYEVIEDDLANLKKYQQENKQLRAKLTSLAGPGAVAEIAPEPSVGSMKPEHAKEPEMPKASAAQASEKAPEPVKEPEPAVSIAKAEPAPAASPAEPKGPDASPLGLAEETVSSTQVAASFEELAGKVNESLATQPAGASVVDPAAAVAAQIAPPAADAPKPAGGEEPGKEMSEADLLSEFERMLNS